jgi:excisionase family DNA binding protein
MQVGDVAVALGISRASAYEGVKTGDIPSIRIGRRFLVPTAAVRRLLQLDSGPDAAA